ncbi:G-type lectin S-receptor-like serine/threonine-protein kinase [Camellia lanceoleosa]|uniref:G-type lectin S-receptor-like serine/threonine-protein kinase n=1 Tax=Camellia lanceoleosa TaxID=1840588 RepID=A0ACC0GGJ3_9ERIC|nr:G-type lectin S-receptor-like serine/threonine-protein kinase [Camellia lanceoleosa]
MYNLVAEVRTEPMMYAHGGGTQDGYGMVQCSRDISGQACSANCLGNLMAVAEKCCQGQIGWRILAPSCNLRYENYSFLTPPVPPPVPTTTSKGNVVENTTNIQPVTNGNTTKIVLITVPISTFLVVTFGFYFYRLFGRRSEAREGFLQNAWRLWNDGKAQELIDRNLIGSCPVRKVAIWINIALLCVQENPDDRPSMSKVAFMLGGQSTEIAKPSEPPFSVGRYPVSNQWSSTGEGTEPAIISLTLPRE